MDVVKHQMDQTGQLMPTIPHFFLEEAAKQRQQVVPQIVAIEHKKGQSSLKRNIGVDEVIAQEEVDALSAEGQFGQVSALPQDGD